MKTNPLVVFTAAAGALLLLLVIVLFAQQSDQQKEIVSLRASLQATQTSRMAPAKPAEDPPSWGTSTNTRSSLDPVASADSSDHPQDRLADLERVVDKHADLLEDLFAERARIAEERRKALRRSWGPEQAVGAPDTLTAGDQATAWAPAVADGGIEWLEAEFESAADLAKIVVRQTNNPGGITKVTAITDSGAEVPVWTGIDPSAGQALADTPFAVPGGINARRVKVYIDTSKKPGWEEIDAMQIVGRDGAAQWAKSVNASSTYAGGRSVTTTGGTLMLNGVSGDVWGLEVLAAPNR